MDAKTQIISLSISFVYGAFFYFTSLLNQEITKNTKRIFRSVAAILHMYIIVLLYIIILYKINNGNFHIYFFIMLTLGFIAGKKLQVKMLNNVKFLELIEKIKKKCYTKKEK